MPDDFEYYGWRFIEGAFDQGRGMIWSADGTFGHRKYDYFKIAYPDGTLLAADNQHTHHRDNICYGTIGGESFEAEVEEMQIILNQLEAEAPVVPGETRKESETFRPRAFIGARVTAPSTSDIS